MPLSMVTDLLSVHRVVSEAEQEEMNKLEKQAQSQTSKIR